MRNVIRWRGRWIGYGLVIALLHIIGIVWVLVAARANPALGPLGLIAYTLGLRHAFDVDHIAAIDNTVRKLVYENRNPLGVGFFFSMGHSTVVFAVTSVTVLSVQRIQEVWPRLHEIGSIIGTTVSGGFLLLIGCVNLWMMMDILRLLREHSRQDKMSELVTSLHHSGMLTRLVQPLLNSVRRSWHVYPLGMLFGLGFDTASEVMLLALSAGAVHSSASVADILVLPVLFAAGMTLMDTADGVFAAKAYQWASSTPLRKVYYNLTATGLAVVVALLIGVTEVAQALSGMMGLRGGFWDWLQNLDLSALGYVMVIVFGIIWAVFYGAWRWLVRAEGKA
ncbi:MAG: HoxN/HupN/NixA family nickel/cobalt transporter [Alicyclobacillaceae bacterium]|nr:HoxN/HupN/NixA family nickel/cobalt transporter [Alicyclobacillaceae bacterium]